MNRDAFGMGKQDLSRRDFINKGLPALIGLGLDHALPVLFAEKEPVQITPARPHPVARRTYAERLAIRINVTQAAMAFHDSEKRG
jgi:hypothetical protein